MNKCLISTLCLGLMTASCQQKAQTADPGAESTEMQGEQPAAPSLVPVTPASVGAIELGMLQSAVPQSVKGFYDSFQVTHHAAEIHESESDELDDSYTVPAYDAYTFQFGDREVMQAYGDEQGIYGIHVYDSRINYAGIFPGMPLRDAIRSGLHVLTNAAYQSCDGYVEFRKDDVLFKVQVDYEETALEKMSVAADHVDDYTGMGDAHLLPEDVSASSVIESITLGQTPETIQTLD